MNTNEIRFYMHNIDNLKADIREIQDNLDQYRRMNISGIKAQVITSEPITHSNTSKTELMALTRMEYIHTLETELDHKMRIIRAINSVTLYLNDIQREIFELRYVVQPVGRPKYNWYEISQEVHKSEDWCKEVDCKIVRRIQDKHMESYNPQNTHEIPTDIDKAS